MHCRMKAFYYTNTWNKIRYTLYLPVYDAVLKTFAPQREAAIGQLNLQGNERVLIVGAGSGLDLPYLPRTCQVTAIVITPGMVGKLKHMAQSLDKEVDARVMDAQKLEFADESFDVVLLHLILAVVPDANATIREACRVLKHGGKVSIFDKFLQEGRKVSTRRSFFNFFSVILATDLNRKLEDLLVLVKLKKLSDVPARFGGLFRIICLEKIS